MASPAQITANQANAQLSAGPASPEGKAASSRNALQHGLYSDALFLPGEDPQHYHDLAASYRALFAPAGAEEEALVQTLISCSWRIRRYERIETDLINHLYEHHQNDAHPLGAIYSDRTSPVYKVAARLDSVTRLYYQTRKALQQLQQARPSAEAPAEPAPIATPPEFAADWVRSDLPALPAKKPLRMPAHSFKKRR